MRLRKGGKLVEIQKNETHTLSGGDRFILCGQKDYEFEISSSGAPKRKIVGDDDVMSKRRKAGEDDVMDVGAWLCLVTSQMLTRLDWLTRGLDWLPRGLGVPLWF